MYADWWPFNPRSEQAGLDKKVALRNQRAGLLRGKKALWPSGGGQNRGCHLMVVVMRVACGHGAVEKPVISA
ncbi:hypothetical protein [Pantoea sp. AS142]|uniref:hypothetical protein n=1 Tax=Pantoea sp. AS142 TaxID=3081292 RepID=UPI00301AA39F